MAYGGICGEGHVGNIKSTRSYALLHMITWSSCGWLNHKATEK